MVGSLPGPKGARLALFGLAALTFILMPVQTGNQEWSPLGPTEAMHNHAAASAPAFDTIRAATLSLPRPIGTTVAHAASLRFASLGDIRALDISGAIDRVVRGRRESPILDALAFPAIERARKGDFLAARPEPEEEPEPLAAPGISGDEEIEAAARFVPFPEYDISMSLESHPHVPGDEPVESPDADATQPDISLLALANDPDPTARTSRLFFGDLVGSSVTGIVPWTRGEEPVLMMPRAPDSDLKPPVVAALPAPALAVPDRLAQGGETVAGKGEVTGDDQRPGSPADRLGLSGKRRDKAEKCLANAVYFEARGESLRGQIAVAQVVLNRSFSGYYPGDVCGVVYQNAHRHLACQFTFACDGIPDVVTEPDAWARAKRVAKAALDGKVWLPEIGKATHYHAYWVHPWWVRTMRKLARIGVHSFYRPRRWGDGETAPSWGSAAVTAELAAKL